MTKKEKQFIEDMKRVGLDFPRIGMMVQVDGDIGTILGVNSSGNLEVIFANQQRHGKYSHFCHPTWEIVYFDRNGEIIADYRAKKESNND